MALATRPIEPIEIQNVWAPKPPEIPGTPDVAPTPVVKSASEYAAPLAPSALEETGLTSVFIEIGRAHV